MKISMTLDYSRDPAATAQGAGTAGVTRLSAHAVGENPLPRIEKVATWAS